MKILVLASALALSVPLALSASVALGDTVTVSEPTTESSVDEMGITSSPDDSGVVVVDSVDEIEPEDYADPIEPREPTEQVDPGDDLTDTVIDLILVEPELVPIDQTTIDTDAEENVWHAIPFIPASWLKPYFLGSSLPAPVGNQTDPEQPAPRG